MESSPISQVRPVPTRPLLKWPGGKRFLLKSLLALIPQPIDSYFEPFVGGGAVYFYLLPPNAILTDTNTDLINCYAQVRDDPEAVLQYLRDMQNTPSDYYAIREMQPATPAQAAAQLIYLMTLSFNGIYRVNLNGHFNVPYGWKTHLRPYAPEHVMAVHHALQGTTLEVKDFEAATRSAVAGSVIYFDPPYTLAHSNNGFIKYNANLFSWDDQLRLARLSSYLRSRGCTVLISNADHPSIRALYPDFSVATVARPSRISASAKFRSSVSECIFYCHSEVSDA